MLLLLGEPAKLHQNRAKQQICQDQILKGVTKTIVRGQNKFPSILEGAHES